MFKLANVIIDQYDDPNFVRTLTQLAPSLTKTASEAKKVYALKIVAPHGTYYKFPLDTPFDTLMSAKYFEKSAGDLPVALVPEIAARIKKALDTNRVDSSKFEFINKVAAKEVPTRPVVAYTWLPEHQKTANDVLAKENAKQSIKQAAELTYQQRESLPDSDFAIVIKKDNTKIRKYPIHDESHVRNAITRFAQHYNKLPPSQRAEAARKIKQKAKQYGIEISKDNIINKYASDTLSPYFWFGIRKRQELTKNAAYEKLAEYVKYVKDLNKIAEMIEQLDKITGFDEVWNIYGDPYETVMSKYRTYAEKLAAETGNPMPKTPEDQAKLDMIAKYFGEEVAKEAESNSELFQQLCEELGI